MWCPVLVNVQRALETRKVENGAEDIYGNKFLLCAQCGEFPTFFTPYFSLFNCGLSWFSISLAFRCVVFFKLSESVAQTFQILFFCVCVSVFLFTLAFLLLFSLLVFFCMSVGCVWVYFSVCVSVVGCVLVCILFLC